MGLLLEVLKRAQAGGFLLHAFGDELPAAAAAEAAVLTSSLTVKTLFSNHASLVHLTAIFTKMKLKNSV